MPLPHQHHILTAAFHFTLMASHYNTRLSSALPRYSIHSMPLIPLRLLIHTHHLNHSSAFPPVSPLPKSNLLSHYPLQRSSPIPRLPPTSASLIYLNTPLPPPLHILLPPHISSLVNCFRGEIKLSVWLQKPLLVMARSAQAFIGL